MVSVGKKMICYRADDHMNSEIYVNVNRADNHMMAGYVDFGNRSGAVLKKLIYIVGGQPGGPRR